MKSKTLISLAMLFFFCASADAVVRTAVKNGKRIIYNDGIGESSHEALKRSDEWLAARVALPSLYDDLIALWSSRHSLDPKLVKSVMLVESGFNPAAISPKGARGLMQLMPATAAAQGVRDIHDPAENIAGGTRHLSYLLGVFGGNLEKSLAAYNAGEAAVVRHGGVPPYVETWLYVHKALTAYHGKSELTGGFGMPPNQTWASRPGRPIRVVRDSGNRVLLTTARRGERPSGPLTSRSGLRRG